MHPFLPPSEILDLGPVCVIPANMFDNTPLLIGARTGSVGGRLMATWEKEAN